MSADDKAKSRRVRRFERLKREVGEKAAQLEALPFPVSAQDKRRVTLALNGLLQRARALRELMEEVRK